jgi:hypothetical protein
VVSFGRGEGASVLLSISQNYSVCRSVDPKTEGETATSSNLLPRAEKENPTAAAELAMGLR